MPHKDTNIEFSFSVEEYVRIKTNPPEMGFLFRQIRLEQQNNKSHHTHIFLSTVPGGGDMPDFYSVQFEQKSYRNVHYT